MGANGCGPAWVPDIWRDYYFNDECNLHDMEYSDSEMTQHQADRLFYDRMLEKISKEPSFWVRRKRAAQAWAFYHLVRNFGHHFKE